VVRTIDGSGVPSIGRGDTLYFYYHNRERYSYFTDLTLQQEVEDHGGRFSSALEFALLGVEPRPKGFK
jgi:hypothetical protein